MSIFKFRSFSAYFRDFIQTQPKKGRGEISRIAQYLRVSTTLVSQVLSGKKNFTVEQIEALRAYLGLTALESEYLLTLVLYDRAGTTSLKKYWASKLDNLSASAKQLVHRVHIDRTLTDHEKAVYYSSPLYGIIQLFTSVGKNGKSLEEISQRFEVSRTKAAGIIRFLLDTGLCEEKDGLYTMGTQKTHLEQGSPFLPRHHSNWRVRAIRRSEDLNENELMYTGVVSLAQKDFLELREQMAIFIKKFLDQVHASPAEELACFNLDFFWIKK